MKTLKKSLAVLLSVLMLFSVISITAFATDEETTKTYIVAGSDALCGAGSTGYGWDTTDTTNAMTDNGDGTYTKVYTDVAAGTYEIKVTLTEDGNVTWYGNGEANVAVAVEEAGSTVTITFTAETQAIDVTVEAPKADDDDNDGDTNPSSTAAENDGDTNPSSTAAENDGDTNPSSTAAENDGNTDPSSTAAENDGNTDPSASETEGATSTDPSASETEGATATDPSASETEGATATDASASETEGATATDASATETEGNTADTNATAGTDTTYCLVGYINGANVGIDDDEATVTNEFVDGKITLGFTQDSYVAVKTADNAVFYMTNDWLGFETTSTVLYDKTTLAAPNKLFVPAATVEFTLVVNDDNTVTLSYEVVGEAPSTEAVTTEPTSAPKTEMVTFEPTPVEDVAVYDGYYFVVAGVDTLCGTGWDPANKDNELVYNTETKLWEKTYTNVAAGTYEFKVTTNGAWDVADYNLVGDAKFGGANAVVVVTEADSTLRIAFDAQRAYAWINGEQVAVEVEVTEPATGDTTNTDPSATAEATDPSVETTEPATDDTTPTESTEPTTETKLTAKAGKTKLAAGKTTTVKVTGATGTVTYKSSNAKVAKVAANGKVTALKNGTVTITAKADGKKATVKITVTSSPKLSKKAVSVKVNKKTTVKITGKAAGTKVKVSKCKVAKITVKNKKLVIKGIKKGTKTVKVTVNGVKLNLKVTVKKK